MKTKNVNIKYDSVLELANAIENDKEFECWRADSSFSLGDEHWREWAVCTLPEAIDRLRNGDADTANMINAKGEIIAHLSKGSKPKVETSIIGCAPNVPNYLRGVPNSMLRVVTVPRSKPVIDLYVNSSIYDGIDTDKVFEKALMIANTIAATEANGVRVNLYAICGINDHKGGSHTMAVKIKEASAPLNLLTVAFCVCSRGFCRTIFMKWQEQHIDFRVRGYGCPLDNEKMKQAAGIENAILFDIKELVRKDSREDDITKVVNDYLAKR